MCLNLFVRMLVVVILVSFIYNLHRYCEQFSEQFSNITGLFTLRENTWSQSLHVGSTDCFQSYNALTITNVCQVHPITVYDLAELFQLNVPPQGLFIRSVLHIFCKFERKQRAQVFSPHFLLIVDTAHLF